MEQRAVLAPSLARLRRETDLEWPRRSKDVDGWVGDAAHRRVSSDHNPNSDGYVLALDVTTAGINVLRFVVDVTHHPAVWYVIVRGVLYSATHGFVGVPYEGVNPHRDHVHVNLRHAPGAVHSRRLWLTAQP